MRKLFVTEFMSLDGVIENPMWTIKYWNDDIAAFKGEESNAADALLLGRVTYDGFAQAWPQRTDEESGGVYFNGVAKYVVSNTLKSADWNNSHIISGDVVAGIQALKAQPGKDIAVHGSGVLVQTLMQHNLVDEFRFLIYPVVLGKGQRLFTDIPATLELVEQKTFGSVIGVVYKTTQA